MSEPTRGEVAAELRRLADRIESGEIRSCQMATTREAEEVRSIMPGERTFEPGRTVKIVLWLEFA